MIDRLKKILKRNDWEIKNIQHETISEGAMKDYVSNINSQNETIEKYLSENEKIDKKLARLHQEKNSQNKELIDCDIKDLEEEKEDAEDILYRTRQGKIKNIISACFNQVDKRIHNGVFDHQNKVSNFLWNNYEKRVHERYESLAGYITKNGLIMSALFLIILIGYNFLPGLNLLTKLIEIGNACFITNTIVKTISTIYNKWKFGGFNKLTRFKKLLRGNYIENIKATRYDYTRARELTDENIPINDKKYFEERVSAYSDSDEIDEILEIEKEKITDMDDVKRPNMRDYGNLGICLNTESDTMAYSKAISAIRRSNDNDKRMEAYAKLANTFGKNKKKKNKNTDISKLTDFSKTLKLVSEYGRKTRSSNATKEDAANYIALLYHLGKDFDSDYDITDFLSDEYDRFQEDLQKYEEQKVLKKVR